MSDSYDFSAKDILDKQDREGMLFRALENAVVLYSDKTHFVFELLQNAEDAKATHVSFRQFSDHLEFIHNGNPFTESNFKSLCDFGLSDKKEQENTIGRFGIGFKSVFTICNSVELYSKYSEHPKGNAKKINNYIFPTDIDWNWDCENIFTTKFVFPYYQNEKYYKSLDELRNSIAKRLKELGTNILLFMKNIKEIHYSINEIDKDLNGEGLYTLQKKNIADNVFKVITSDGSNNNDNTYLVFSKKIPETERTVDIAFLISNIDNNGVYNFNKTKLDKISVYFPTTTESKVNFIVQAPFDLVPNRSNLEEKSEHNEKLKEFLTKLLKDAIFFIRDKKWLSLEFINLLPYKAMGNENDWALYDLYKETITLLKTEPVIPCIDGSYITANNAKIVRGKDLLNIFKDKYLCELINQPDAKWLSGEFTETNKSLEELHRFFKKYLDVEEIGSNDLPRLIKNNPSFFSNVSDSWLKDFYSYLYKDVKGLLGKNGDLATIPFIKTTDGYFDAPYRSNGKGQKEQNIYLKPKNAHIDINGFLFIDDFIIQNCPDFVEALDLGVPDNYDCFIKGLENTKNKRIDDNIHILQVKQALKYLKDGYHENMIDNFKSLLKFKFIDTYEKEQYFVIDYIINNLNKKIYRENDINGISIKNYCIEVSCNVLFLNETYYINNEITLEDLSLLGKLGIKNNIYIGLDKDDWNEGKAICSNIGDFRKRLSLNYIDNVLKYIHNNIFSSNSKEKSNIIMNLLKNVEKHLSGKWQPIKTSSNSEDDVSCIISLLKEEKWLYSKNNLVNPSDISRYDLDTDIYGQVDDKSKIYKLLGFKETPYDKQRKLLYDFDSKYKEEEIRLIYDHIYNKLQINNTISPPSSTPDPNKLRKIYDWWKNKSNYEKQSLANDYEKSLYPEWFKKEDLKSESNTEIYNRAWFTLFAIAICQQRGWSSDSINNSFLKYLNDNLWFDKMIKHKSDNSEIEWMKIIKEYYKLNTTDQKWQEWIKLIPQFFIIRNDMEEWISLMRGLDNKKEEFELTTTLKPNTDPDLKGSGIDLPALNRTLRIGLPFIIRELLRFNIIKSNRNLICHAFMPKERTAKIVMGENYDDNLTYTSRDIFKEINDKLNMKEYTFDGYYDIPMLIYKEEENNASVS